MHCASRHEDLARLAAAASAMPGRKIVSPKLQKSAAAPVELFRNEFVLVLKDAEHPVATVWLCREEKRNALGPPVLAAIECALPLPPLPKCGSNSTGCRSIPLTTGRAACDLSAERRSCFCIRVSTSTS